MKTDKLTQTLLAIIAVALVMIALRPLLEPTPAHADDKSAVVLSVSDNTAWVYKEGRISAYRATNTTVDHIGSSYIR